MSGDFSYLAMETPSVLLWLGVVPKDVEKTALHSPTFIAAEESIPVGVRIMSSVILDCLERPGEGGQTRR